MLSQDPEMLREERAVIGAVFLAFNLLSVEVAAEHTRYLVTSPGRLVELVKFDLKIARHVFDPAIGLVALEAERS